MVHHRQYSRPLGGLLATFACLAALVMPASAAPMLNFLIVDEVGVSDGLVAYGGGATPMATVGDGIDVDLIFGTGTPLNSGLGSGIACVSCKLTFLTGDRLALPGRVFDGGGFLALSGLVPAAGIVTPQILMAGAFEGALVVDLNPLSGALTGFTAASFLDFKNEQLADYFGLPGFPVVYTGGLLIGLTGVEDPATGAFLAGILDGGLVTNQVPSPGTLLLAMLGLLALGHATHRSRRSRV